MAREGAVFPARGAARCRTPEGDAAPSGGAAFSRARSMAIDGRRKGRRPAARRGEGKGTPPNLREGACPHAPRRPRTAALPLNTCAPQARSSVLFSPAFEGKRGRGRRKSAGRNIPLVLHSEFAILMT